MKSWLGRCHLYQGEGADRVDYEAVVAVFCAKIEAFDVAVRAHLEGKDMRLLWSEARNPVGEWLAMLEAERDLSDLMATIFIDIFKIIKSILVGAVAATSVIVLAGLLGVGAPVWGVIVAGKRIFLNKL